MNFKRIRYVLLLLFTFCLSQAQANTLEEAQQADCYYATSDMVGKCAGHAAKNDFAFSAAAKMLTPQSVMIARLILSSYYDDLSIVADKSKEGEAIQAIVKGAVDVIGIFAFLMVGLAVLYNIYKNASDASVVANQNKALLIFCWIAAIILVGYGWIIHTILAAAIVCFVLTIQAGIFLFGILFDSSVKDESAFTTRGNIAAELYYNNVILNAIQMSAEDISLRRKLLVKHNLIKDVNTGRFKFVETAFSRCLEQPAPQTVYDGEALLVGEIVKTKQCMKEGLQINVYSPGIIKSSQSEIVKMANIRLFDGAYEEARKNLIYMCNTGLDKGENRQTYADSELLLNDCLDIKVDGSVADKDTFVHEYRESVTADQLRENRDQLVGIVKDTVDTVVRELLDKTEKEKIRSDLFSMFISLMHVNSFQKKIHDAVDAEYKGFVVTVDQKLNAADSSAALNENDAGNSRSNLLSDSENVKLFNIKKSIYDVYLTGGNNDLSGLTLGAIQKLLNMMTAKYYENIGFQFKSCFKTGANCYSPVLNAPAALFSNSAEYTQMSLSIYYGAEVLRNGILTFNKNERYLTNTLSGISKISMFMYLFFMGSQILFGILPIIYLMGELGTLFAGIVGITIILCVRILKAIMPGKSEDHAFDVFKNILLQHAWICLHGPMTIVLFVVGIVLISNILVIVNEVVYHLSSIFMAGGTGLIFDVIRMLVMLFLHHIISIVMFVVFLRQVKSINVSFKELLVAKDIVEDKRMGEKGFEKVKGANEKFTGSLKLQSFK